MENFNLVEQPSTDKEKFAWLQWSEYHRLIFGWRSEADTEMLLSWIGLFRRSGLTPESLTAATEAITKQETPPYGHAAHLNSLTMFAKIWIKKRNPLLPSLISLPLPVRCSLCTYPGLVAVPVLSPVDNTSNQTFAYCSCPMGVNYGSHRNISTQYMAYTTYEFLNPDWKSQLKSVRQIQPFAPENKLDHSIQRIIHRMNLFSQQKVLQNEI